MNSNLLKKAIAECIGTFVLVFVACGVAAITAGDLVATSLAFGLVIVAMAYSIGRISGCHINPAVSIAMLITKKMTLVEFLVYVCAQVIGGLLGAVLIFGIAKMADYNLAGNACNYFVNSVQGGFGDTKYVIDAGKIIASIIVEVVLTFIFVYVILNATSKKAAAPKLAGIIIGFTLVLVHLVGIGLTGTSVNPARSIATAFGDLFFNGKADALAQLWVFIVAPLAGGALAAVVYNLLHKKDDESAEASDAE